MPHYELIYREKNFMKRANFTEFLTDNDLRFSLSDFSLKVLYTYYSNVSNIQSFHQCKRNYSLIYMYMQHFTYYNK